MLAYGILNQRSPDYRANVWRELDDLYTGGYALAANAATYLPKLPGESPARYDARLLASGYIGYLGQIVDYFTASLFGQDLSITEAADADDPLTNGGKSDVNFYSEFSSNADLQGNSFAQVERKVFRTAVLKKKGLLAVDLPTSDNAGDIVSLADEDASGSSRAYVFELPIESLIDWEYDDFGAFEYAVIYRQTSRRASPESVRGSEVVDEFKVWRMSGATARWEIYRLTRPASQEVKPDTQVPLVGEGNTSFRSIPLVEFVVPDGLWIGNKIGTLAKEHFQRRSALVAAEYKSLVAIPYIKRGPEMSAIGDAMVSETQQNPHRGSDPSGRFNNQGWVEIGKDDEIGFVEPSGSCYGHTRDELKELKTEMFRVVHQMAASVDNTAGNMGRSGASKKQDRGAEAVVLAAYGQAIREHAKKTFTVISLSRGEDVVWTPRGLDRFETDDRAELLAEALQVDLVAIPSKTFKQEYKTQMALKLVASAPPETQDAIRQEILEGVETEADTRDLDSDTKLVALTAQALDSKMITTEMAVETLTKDGVFSGDIAAIVKALEDEGSAKMANAHVAMMALGGPISAGMPGSEDEANAGAEAAE